ncbi:MAG: flagellin lysine-N-methylase, partial [Lachnospiraceae bacterium]|nr:flagellin lysine-N-methylase [Lachnospiraceae bacterium]
MLLRIPDFYDSFHCLGGKCPDNCCIGSELDIDDDTFAYYQAVEGPFGDRLRANMAAAVDSPEDGAHSFHLQVGGRCPFLNADNLCDISLELGPDALCSICTEYPRQAFEWGGVMEKSLTLSCPEAGRLLFLNDIPVTFKEIPLDESGLAAYMDDEMYGEMGANEHDPDDREPAAAVDYELQGEMSHDNSGDYGMYAESDDGWDEINPKQLPEIEQIRNECLQILQGRTLPIEKRVARYLQICKCTRLLPANAGFPLSEKSHQQADESNQNPLPGEIGIPSTVQIERAKELTLPAEIGTPASVQIEQAKELPSPTEIGDSPLRDDFAGFKKRLEILAGMEILSSQWTSIMDSLEGKLGHDELTYRRILNSYIASDDYRKYAYTYEHLLVYFTFRYFPLAVYDFDLPGKARFAVFSTLVIRDLDALRYCERGAFTFADRIETAASFSKQVEHSEYNTWHLLEAVMQSRPEEKS